MPHQCVRCNTFYEDGSAEILKGCKCGSRLFFFVKKEAIEQAKTITSQLTEPQKEQIEEDVLDILDARETDEAVVLDLESVRCTEPGKFELDIVQLFNKEYPVVFKMEEGKYAIDVPETFARRGELKAAKAKKRNKK
ncbi:Zn-ribbon domain-containing protein [Candidatus Woesearchaeota archaeon]|nr:Zn-ribbon domain-containing protein [Candidatus Woesearchaeota archaeon]